MITNMLQPEGGGLVQWLKVPAWKVGDDGLEHGIQVSNKQIVSSSLTRKDSIVCVKLNSNWLRID